MPDPTPAILEMSNQFRAALLRRERAAASRIVTYYGRIWGRLQSDITNLEQQVRQAQAGGDKLTQGEIWRLERMRAIQRQAADEIERFAPYAAKEIAAGQREAIAAGSRDAQQLVLAGFPRDAGVEVSFAQLPREAVEQIVGFVADGSPLEDVLRKHAGDAAQGMGNTLVEGLAVGWNPTKVARTIRQAFGVGLSDALRVARTEMLRAYREATRNTYKANSDVVKGWERHAAQDDRTCMACVMLDGKRYGLDEPMDDHVQGRCEMLPITATYRELGIDAPEPDFKRELAGDWFRRQSDATQQQMMGAKAWQAWKDGKFQLEDIPKLTKSRVWGNSWTPKSLGDLTR